MSNIFKTNNRFSVLNDDDSDNTFKNKIRNVKENNKFEKKNPNTNDFLYKKKDEKMNRMIEKNLSMDSFPELSKKEKNLEQNILHNDMNFLEKMKNNISQENESELDIEYKNLKPGWVLIRKDPVTNKIHHKYKKGINNSEKYLEKKINDDFINNSQIINTLIDLHKKRTDDYIELWGYNDWEQMFRFPNHDYDYFDKLDEWMEDEIVDESVEEQENY